MWFNPIMVWLLKSALHPLISGSTVLVQYTGRKTQQAYATPVNYVRQGDDLYTISFAKRTWWRNLLPSATVKLLLQGKTLPAEAFVYQDAPGIAEALRTIFRQQPQYAGYLKVKLIPGEEPNPEELLRAAEGRVCIRFHLR